MSSTETNNTGTTNSENDYLLKILLIGDNGVGKSQLLLRFADDTYTESYVSTVGVDFKIRTVKIENKSVKLQIWDTTGQQQFKTITSSYYRGTHGVLLVFDVNDQSSFQNIQHWINEVNKYTEGVEMMLVGNNLNNCNDSRVVDFETANVFASERSMTYFETSPNLSSSNHDVEEAFLSLTRSILRRIHENHSYLSGNRVNNNNENNINNNNKCRIM